MTDTIRYNNLFLVAYLLTKNYESLSQKEVDRARVEFVFTDTEELRKDADDFLSDELISIKLESYTKKYRDLLVFVHNRKFLKLEK